MKLTISPCNTAILLPMLSRYAFEFQRNIGPATWVIDTFLDLSVPHESLLTVLEAMFYADEVPFRGRNRRYIARDIVHVIKLWFTQSTGMLGIGMNGGADSLGMSLGMSGGGERMFGSEENAGAVVELLRAVTDEDPLAMGVERNEREEWRVLRMRVEAALRR